MKQGWEIKKLGEVCEVICGQDYKAVKDDNGKYPIYGTGGVMGYASQYRCPSNSVIIGRKGSINNPLFVETEFWNVDTAFGVVPNKEVLCPKFFFLFCKSFDFTRLDVSVTIPSLRRVDILQIPIPVPPLPVQEQIVSELDLLSGIIEKKRKQLKELDALAQSIFYDMFGDPITNEKGWEVKKLGEVCESVSYGTSNSSTENGEYKYLRMNNITYSGHIDITDIKYIDISDDEYEKYVVRKGDILFNRTNSKDLVGKTALFNFEEEMIIAGYIIRVRVNQDSIIPTFVVKWLNTPLMKSYFKNICKGAVNQSNINSKELKNIPISIPPLPLQHQFASKIEAIEKQKELIKQSISETETLFNERMQHYFN